MIAEHNGSLGSLRSGLTLAVAPFQYLVNWPMDTMQWLQTSMATSHQLRVENAQLRSNELLLQAKVQKLIALENENAELKAVLRSSEYVPGKTEVAQLLEVALSPFIQQVLLDKGSYDQVFLGQPVLDAYGVIGQVIEVGPATARVRLITDPESGVPVQNSRNGERAVLVGTGYGGELKLMYVPETADFQVGDQLMTSGLGRCYPAGYPVGIVTQIEHQSGMRFALIRVKPSAHLNSSRQLLLVWLKQLKSDDQITSTQILQMATTATQNAIPAMQSSAPSVQRPASATQSAAAPAVQSVMPVVQNSAPAVPNAAHAVQSVTLALQRATTSVHSTTPLLQPGVPSLQSPTSTMQVSTHKPIKETNKVVTSIHTFGESNS